MNLWVKRIGQLVMVAALFFVSCVEESTLLGFKAKSRFAVLYKELPINSSIFLIDSLNTTNYGSGDRFLVGEYVDDALGKVNASAYSQYYRSGIIPDSLALSDLDSVSMRLSFDYYNYGSGMESGQQISVYTLADTLINISKNTPFYYSQDSIKRDVKVGGKTFQITPAVFNQYLDEYRDDNTTPPLKYVTIPLDKEIFGRPIFESAISYETTKDDPDKTKRDTTFVTYSLFTKEFKGITIKAAGNDKILGFNPASAETKITLHFHLINNNKRDSIVLRFSGLTSFNQIVSDRAGSDVSELQYENEYVESSQSDFRYIENGVGIVTKLDLSSFIQFVDTIPAMSINSAEILVNNVPVQTDFQRPQLGLGIRVLYDNNRFRNDATQANATAISAYKGTVSFASAQSAVPNGYINNERSGEPLVMPWVSTDTEKKYNGFTSLFAQELYRNHKNGGPVFSKLALYSLSPNAGKNVDRVSFHKDNVKLRIYYTIPTIDSVE